MLLLEGQLPVHTTCFKFLVIPSLAGSDMFDKGMLNILQIDQAWPVSSDKSDH